MGVNLEEYKKFLEENGYNEEINALGVVNEILDYHMEGSEYRDVQLFPHHVIKRGNNRFEFDLVIHLIHKYEGFNKWIGVEFKETDVRKVVRQAVARREFVDYMYIATRWVHLDFEDLLLLSYEGIGWVIWNEELAKLIVPSKYCPPATSLNAMIGLHIYYMAERNAKNIVPRVVEKEVKKQLSSLDRWLLSKKEGDNHGRG